MSQSGQSKSNDDSNCPTTGIPAPVRQWESVPCVASSVRRPSTLPDPTSYHTAIEPEAIFELDEKQEDGSIETILVVSFGCTRCKRIKQLCSRTYPTCVRCRKAPGETCVVTQGGYQRLPGPKVGRPSLVKKTATCAGEENATSSSAPQESSSSRRVGRVALCLSRDSSFDSAPPISHGSKRPLSPESEYIPPRKKSQTKAPLRKGAARHSMVMAAGEMSGECSEVAVGASGQVSSMVSACESNVLKWTFVNSSLRRNERSSRRQDHIDAVPSKPQVPRVWTNSLDGLFTVFPELAKTPVGFSWFQSETPILLLDTNCSQGHWINPTTLTVDFLWDFSCHDFELEAVVRAETGRTAEVDYPQSMARSQESALDRGIDTTDLRHSCLSSSVTMHSTYETASSPLPTFSTGMQQLDGTSQCERDTCANQAEWNNPIHTVMPNDSSASCSKRLHPYHSPPPEDSSPSQLYSVPSGSLTHHIISEASSQPRIPLNKPPEVETLLNSQAQFIPLLVWISHESGLLPCNLLQEYAYSCMGLFFISDLRHTVVQHSISSVSRLVQGRVGWSVTLQWAPGGEDTLIDCDLIPSSDMIPNSASPDITKDLLHPWWFRPTSQADKTTHYRPRDLRMQCFSLIPLDLLADFCPSETFPRGWYCGLCGMINVQTYFRHQICQSSACSSARENRVPEGTVDVLSSLRDIYQSSTVIQPTNTVPSLVVSDAETWDDGMQSWIYNINDGVTLCHVFTGNQECLQVDATILLERIQREVLLYKEDPLSPYFTHTTRFIHPRDKTEIMVSKGTPDSIRIAYYTLCDFVRRYAEMDKPRFGRVLIQAWVTTGQKRGTVLSASESPVVVLCLGVEVTLNLTPKRGYQNATEPTGPDKGKGHAIEVDLAGSVPTDPLSEPLEQAGGDLTSFISGSEANQSPIVAEHADGGAAAMDTARQHHNFDTDGVASGSNVHSGPGMGAVPHEVAEPKQRRGRKKKIFINEKSKASVPEISMTLLHGDCLVLCGDDFECQIVRNGTTILVIGLPEEA